MVLEPGILISAILAGIGGVVWAVRIEGKVNAHTELFAEREKLAGNRHDQLEKRLIRIEEKIDRGEELNGKRQSTRAGRYGGEQSDGT